MCGGSIYTPSTQFCDNGIQEKCNGKKFNPANQRCENNIIENQCGTGWYNPANESTTCSGGSVVFTYVNITYESQTYKTIKIGNQTWMAENLNYDVEDSECYEEEADNCALYGRLYDWATAMGFDASCNANSCASQIQNPHRGICPSGWHIPSGDEWEELRTFVGGYEIAGKKLKAREGWTDCGISGKTYLCEDVYGFSALPGGNNNSTWSSVGDLGYWWGSTEYENAPAIGNNVTYSTNMAYNLDILSWSQNGAKFPLLSVRCVKD
jgi:uncharacterized protein (TIGR02145 family)